VKTFRAHACHRDEAETRYRWATSPPAEAGPQGRHRRRGQPVGALLFRAMFAKAEEVGERRQLRRAGR
jgi:hypothetical protein